VRCLKLLLARLGLATTDMQIAIIEADIADIDRAIEQLKDQRNAAMERLATTTIKACNEKQKAERLLGEKA